MRKNRVGERVVAGQEEEEPLHLLHPSFFLFVFLSFQEIVSILTMSASRKLVTLNMEELEV